MAMKPVLKKLIREAADHYNPERHLKRDIRLKVHNHNEKIANERAGWFDRRHLPSPSVLARLTRYDREAVFAHFRAKELRNVADAMHDRNFYAVKRARKHLDRVSELAEVFAEVEREG